MDAQLSASTRAWHESHHAMLDQIRVKIDDQDTGPGSWGSGSISGPGLD